MPKKYDVIVIGSGIGGLVCGCYLAKSGFKTLIVEQHTIPGGYCTSFKRQNFIFDVGIHYIGSIKRGALGKIIQELDIDIKFKRFDPTDKIIMPESTTFLRADYKDTVQEFKKSFPSERKNIDIFFGFLEKSNYLFLYAKYRNVTFMNMLNDFFSDVRLKETMSALMGNIGLSAYKIAAIPAAIFFKEYLMDAGYYPVGGMQAFPDALVARFKKSGGDLMLSAQASEILLGPNNSVKGIRLIGGEKIIGNAVVSNADANLTFNRLLPIKTKEKENIKKLTASPSMFLVYLGLKDNFKEIIKFSHNIWYFSTYDTDKVYSDPKKNLFGKDIKALLFISPLSHQLTKSHKASAIICSPATYENKTFWDSKRDSLAKKMIDKIEEIIPNLNQYVEFTETATPITLYRYTSNYKGSFIGWLPTLQQTTNTLVPQKSSVQGLYLVGHWCTMGYAGIGGIPNVAFSGRRGAMTITKDWHKNWKFKPSPLIK